MDIFDWVHDIEETYNFLLKSTKEESLSEIEEYRKEQDKFLEVSLLRKKAFIKSSMENLSEDIHNNIKEFDGKYIKALKIIEAQFRRNKKNLLKSILNQLGMEF